LALATPTDARPVPTAFERAHLGARTLEGVTPGQHVALPDPSSGKLDRAAVVLRTFIDAHTGVPAAIVRFQSGDERPVALDRLRLSGLPFALKRAYLRWLRERTRAQLRDSFGVDIKPIVRTQRERAFEAQMIRGTDLETPRRWGAYYVANRPGAFGTVFLRREWTAFLPQDRIHESLHAARSPSFGRFVDARKLDLLEEGMVTFLTERVARQHHLPAEAGEAYARPAELIALVAESLGPSAIEHAYLRGSPLDLERALGSRFQYGAIARAFRLLANGDTEGAFAMFAARPNQVGRMRRRLGLSREQLARRAGLTEAAVARAEIGHVYGWTTAPVLERLLQSEAARVGVRL
jgi:hypothetical protein